MPSFGHHYDPMAGQSSLVRSSSANLGNINPYRNLQQGPDFNHQPSYPLNSNSINPTNRRNSLAKLNDFRKKVHEVLDLCADENTDVKTDLSQAVKEERKIYDMLIDNPSLLRRTVSHQSFPQVALHTQQQTVPYNQFPSRQSQRPEQVTTPLGPKKGQKIPQSQFYIQSGSQVAVRQTNYPQNDPYFKPKPQPAFTPSYSADNHLAQPSMNFNGPENLNNLFQELKNHSQVQINPDLLQLIQQIQIQSLEEVQKLRKQKLELMQKLNQQIKNLNQQKKINLQLQQALAQINTRPKNPDGFNLKTQQNSQHLQSIITRLQQELHTSNQINHNLRLELSNRGSGISGIEELLRQGEAIRQETLKLIRIKDQGKNQRDDTNLRVQELQGICHTLKMEKQTALNEVRALRERMGVSQVRTYEEIKLNEKSGVNNYILHPGKTVGQYKDLVSQMKRITGF